MKMIILIFVILTLFAFTLWIRLMKLLDKLQINYNQKQKKRILCEILLHVLRLIVLFGLVQLGLLLFQQ